MEKIKLGLDVGTNSIGWSVVEKQDGVHDFLIKKNEKGNLIPTKGSYIFSKGSDANENSKAAERRGFRGARRRIDRIRLRKIATLKVLDEFGLCPKFNAGELNKWKNKKVYPCENDKFIDWQRTGKKKGISKSQKLSNVTEKLKQPYYLRNLAATQSGMMETVNGKLQLGRAFYHLSQRRGYLSNSDEEQSDDKIDLFKTDVLNLLESSFDSVSFLAPFEVIFDLNKADDKVKKLYSKIKKELKNEHEFEKIKIFIVNDFNKPENLGKVMSGIGELSKEIEGFQTMGCYFYSIYNTTNKKSGSRNKIRGRYTHREDHYLAEFEHICKVQNIIGDLKDKLQNAIFYQRPLKSQKGLVANCTLETKRKRIALSHPLFEEFRMWESINRIKIKREVGGKLDFLNKEEKDLIKDEFLQKTDFEFVKIANKLSKGEPYCYVKKPDEVFVKGKKENLKAIISFNFPIDKKFSACPTTASLKKVIGFEEYNKMTFLNTGYNDEKRKKQLSIEDVWHCLQLDVFDSKDRKTIRKEFAEKHLKLDSKSIESFIKIKLVKGYGNLSKSAIRKIIPFLIKGEIYTNAVFLANITEVLGRKVSENEEQQISDKVKEALELFSIEKQNKGIVNNYISKFKNSKEPFSLGNNAFSIETHKKGLDYEIADWLGELQLNKLESKEISKISTNCLDFFYAAVYDKSPKNINYLTTKTIPEFILEVLKQAFPNETINVSKLYHPSAMEAYPKADKKLGNPEISSIKNPVFNRAMHQIKRLCNELIRNGLVDKDTEVNLEVAGEINSASYRRALSIWQKEQEIIRTWAKNKIIGLNPTEKRNEIIPSSTEITKYILYQEQNHKCLYTSGKEICITDFLGGKTMYDIEHTIPRSKFNDNSLKNKTLANYDFNRNYKKTTLPALLDISFNGVLVCKEMILQNRDKYLKSYTIKGDEITWDVSLSTLKFDYNKFKNAAQSITDAASHDEVMTKAHYTKFKLDYLKEKYRNFEIEEINNQFTNANLVDTRIIAKYARAYLNSYFNKVNVVNGKITDTLRKIWGLQGEEEVKDRSNHIHHCIDAIVVACVERGTSNWISEVYHNYESDYFKGNSNPRIRVKEPMVDFVKRIRDLHKEVLIYHKQTDRIKPLLLHAQKENAKKLNLRGKLNSQNPYAHIKKNDEFIFAQREKVSNLKVKDIEENIIDDGIKNRILDFTKEVGLESFIKESNKAGFMILPKYYDEKKGKDISEMIIKRLRIKSSKSNLKNYKEIRKSDRNLDKDKNGKLKFVHKFDFYFNKDPYTNYEARVYGDLIPDNPGKKIPFTNRSSSLINNYNIVKRDFPNETHKPILKFHQGDMFLVFDKTPEEIEWKNSFDLQLRLFKVVKFTEDKAKGEIKQIIFERHNYALGDVNDAVSTSENDLPNMNGVVLRKSVSALRVIPTKVNTLGEIDIEFSKEFINLNRK